MDGFITFFTLRVPQTMIVSIFSIFTLHEGLQSLAAQEFEWCAMCQLFVNYQKKMHKIASVSLFAACLAASSCGWT